MDGPVGKECHDCAVNDPCTVFRDCGRNRWLSSREHYMEQMGQFTRTPHGTVGISLLNIHQHPFTENTSK